MRARPGITLVEAVLTVAVVAMAAVPASKMFVASSEANAASERETKALVLAQQILESRIRVVPYTQQAAASGTDATSGLTWTLTLTQKGAAANQIRQAEVIVTAAGSAATLIRLATYTANEDIP